MFDTAEYRGRPRLRSRDALRWRLPAVSGLLILSLVATFLGAAYHQVEVTLVTAGAARAAGASEELAGRLAQSMQRVTAASAELQASPEVRALLQRPSDATRRAARAVLVPSGSPAALRRHEIWDTAGSMVLEIATSRADTARGDTARLQAFPRGTTPGGAGMSPLMASGDFAYFEMTTEVRSDTNGRGELLGYYRRFGQLTSSGMSIKRLLGNDAIIRIGVPGSDVWTDFFTVVSPMVREPGDDSSGFVAADGHRWVGAASPIAGSPWHVWVGYPRDVVLRPAELFLQRMVPIALAFLALAVGLATMIGYRITRPLHELATAADTIAGGEYRERVTVARRDEIGMLGRAFNFMSDRVETAYEQLRRSHEQTHLILATAHIGVWEYDVQHDRLTSTDSMRAVHGTLHAPPPGTREEFLGVIHPEDAEQMGRVLAGSTKMDDTVALQYRTVAADGSVRWVEGTAKVRLGDAGGVVVLGVSVDVTSRRSLEMQLRQAQKMEAVGQLAGGVAHDFNNMLTAIMGHAELLREDLPPGSQQREDIDEVLKAAVSAAGLTRQLLTFSRKEVRQAQVISIDSVVASAERLLQRLIGEDVAIVAQLAAGNTRVLADPGQLEQVIVNLVVNARDAMPYGGTITITTGEAELSAEYVGEHASVRPGRYATLAVRDTGTGMDAETQRHLFEPFFTTKPAGKGTGLGLATVFGIVQQSGGHIHVVSESGAGSTFTVFLPVTTAKRHVASSRHGAATPTHGSESVLVVEDSAPVREIAATMLQRLGYRVLTARSGDEALRIADSLGAPLHLLVTDVVMPGMTGPELARRLGERHPALRVLFTSGYSGDALTRHGIDESSARFVEKPYTAETLGAGVLAALQHADIGKATGS